jgi:hypothetical protein
VESETPGLVRTLRARREDRTIEAAICYPCLIVGLQRVNLSYVSGAKICANAKKSHARKASHDS